MISRRDGFSAAGGMYPTTELTSHRPVRRSGKPAVAATAAVSLTGATTRQLINKYVNLFYLYYALHK